MSDRRKKEKKPSKGCMLIQWETLKLDDKGQLICPGCGKAAELILGVFGNPCYAHK